MRVKLANLEPSDWESWLDQDSTTRQDYSFQTMKYTRDNPSPKIYLKLDKYGARFVQGFITITMPGIPYKNNALVFLTIKMHWYSLQ